MLQIAIQFGGLIKDSSLKDASRAKPRTDPEDFVAFGWQNLTHKEAQLSTYGKQGQRQQPIRIPGGAYTWIDKATYRQDDNVASALLQKVYMPCSRACQ